MNCDVTLRAARDPSRTAHALESRVAVMEGLHALSVADARLPDPDTGSVDLADSCHEAADIITARGESQGIRVDTAIQSGMQVRGDVVRLKQILLNLGDNAVKYSVESGCVRIGLTVEAIDLSRRMLNRAHLGVDRAGVIVAQAVTEPTVEDATTGADLVENVDGDGPRTQPTTPSRSTKRPLRAARPSGFRRQRRRACRDADHGPVSATGRSSR